MEPFSFIPTAGAIIRTYGEKNIYFLNTSRASVSQCPKCSCKCMLTLLSSVGRSVKRGASQCLLPFDEFLSIAKKL